MKESWGSSWKTMAMLTEQDDQGLNQGCGEDDRFEACVGESVSDGLQGSGLGDE